MPIRFAILCVVLTLTATHARAQAVTAPANVLSIQPLSAMLTVYAAEYERKLKESTTLGVGGTYWNAGGGDEVKYTSADLKVRYYPNNVALKGFSVGVTLGFSSVTAFSDSTGAEGTVSGPSFGFLFEHQWLLGRQQNFAMTLGAGVKALVVDNIDNSNFTARYPTARISIGYAF